MADRRHRSVAWVVTNRVITNPTHRGQTRYTLPVNADWEPPDVDEEGGVDYAPGGDAQLDVAERALATRVFAGLPLAPDTIVGSLRGLITRFGSAEGAARAVLGLPSGRLDAADRRAMRAEARSYQRFITTAGERYTGQHLSPARQARVEAFTGRAIGRSGSRFAGLAGRNYRIAIWGDWVWSGEYAGRVSRSNHRDYHIIWDEPEGVNAPSGIHEAIERGGDGLLGAMLEICQNVANGPELLKIYALIIEERSKQS